MLYRCKFRISIIFKSNLFTGKDKVTHVLHRDSSCGQPLNTRMPVNYWYFILTHFSFFTYLISVWLVAFVSSAHLNIVNGWRQVKFQLRKHSVFLWIFKDLRDPIIFAHTTMPVGVAFCVMYIRNCTVRSLLYYVRTVN